MVATILLVAGLISMEKKITPRLLPSLGFWKMNGLRAVAENEPALWKQMHRVIDRHKSQKTKSKFINNTLKYHDMGISRWDKKEAVAVGLTLIELMQQHTGIIQIVTCKDARGKSYTYIRPTDEILKWMRDGHEEASIMFPVWCFRRTTCRLKNLFIGGYAAPNMWHRPLVKTQDAAYLEELAVTEMDSVYRAVSASEIPARYHTVAATLQWAWDKARLRWTSGWRITNSPTNLWILMQRRGKKAVRRNAA